jgi:hypothetical protein
MIEKFVLLDTAPLMWFDLRLIEEFSSAGHLATDARLNTRIDFGLVEKSFCWAPRH